jgi:hypothetical protein
MPGRPLRVGDIAAAAGLSTDKSKVEGLRSKLKRLAERLAGRGRAWAVHADHRSMWPLAVLAMGLQ